MRSRILDLAPPVTIFAAIMSEDDRKISPVKFLVRRQQYSIMNQKTKSFFSAPMATISDIVFQKLMGLEHCLQRGIGLLRYDDLLSSI